MHSGPSGNAHARMIWSVAAARPPRLDSVSATWRGDQHAVRSNAHQTRRRRQLTPAPPCDLARWRNGSAWARALRGGIHRVERLARGHEQAVALGAAEADVAAHLGQADAADQLAGRIPHRHAVIADVAAGIARGPDIAIDVAAHAVRPAVHAVDDEVAEQLLIAELVVGADIEHMHIAFAARTGIARSLAGRNHVQLLVVRREREPVGIGHLFLGHDDVEAAAWLDPIAIARQLTLAPHQARPHAGTRMST